MSALTRLIEDLPSLIGEIKRSEITADLQKYMIDKEHEMKLDALRYESALENKNIYLSCDCYEIELKIKKKFKDRIITMINPFGNEDHI